MLRAHLNLRGEELGASVHVCRSSGGGEPKQTPHLLTNRVAALRSKYETRMDLGPFRKTACSAILVHTRLRLGDVCAISRAWGSWRHAESGRSPGVRPQAARRGNYQEQRGLHPGRCVEDHDADKADDQCEHQRPVRTSLRNVTSPDWTCASFVCPFLRVTTPPAPFH